MTRTFTRAQRTKIIISVELPIFPTAFNVRDTTTRAKNTIVGIRGIRLNREEKGLDRIKGIESRIIGKVCTRESISGNVFFRRKIKNGMNK